MRYPTRKPRGFTLIELLAVIAIIAIMATLTLAIINNATESARQSKSINNLRSIGQALQLYAHDNDGRYPPRPRGGATPDENQQGWVSGSLNAGNLSVRDGALFEYIQDEEAYISPTQVVAYPEEDVQLSYAIQRKVYEGSGSHFRDVNLPSGGFLQYPYPGGVKQPSHKIFMVEQVNADDGLYHEGGDRGVDGEIVRGREALFWHNNVSNFLFYDGHVETLEYEDPKADALTSKAWQPGVHISLAEQ
ncbi:MAG: prepilin-type N-terminal cleavage/methylation domain-containing protein [Opitutales bacterium]